MGWPLNGLRSGLVILQPCHQKVVLWLRKTETTAMPRFDPKTMEKRGKSCVTDTWATRSERHRKNIKKKIAREGWQPNINGPYSGFK